MHNSYFDTKWNSDINTCVCIFDTADYFQNGKKIKSIKNKPE